MNVICPICSGPLEADGSNSFTECGHLFHTACLPQPPPNRSNRATHVVKCRACQHPYNLATVRRLYTQSHANLSVNDDLETLRHTHAALIQQRDTLLRESDELDAKRTAARRQQDADERLRFDLIDRLAARDISLGRVRREMSSMRRFVQQHERDEQQLAEWRDKCDQLNVMLDDAVSAEVLGTMRAGHSRRRLAEFVVEEKKRLGRSRRARRTVLEELQRGQQRLAAHRSDLELVWRPQHAELAARLAEAKVRRKQLLRERTMMPQPSSAAGSPFAVRATRRQTVAGSTPTSTSAGAGAGAAAGAGAGAGTGRQWVVNRRRTVDWMEAAKAAQPAVGQRQAAGPREPRVC